MNSRGEFKLQGMLIGTLVAFGLFFSLIASTITSLGGMYDTSEYDETSLTNYSHLDSLNKRIVGNASTIDTDVSINVNVFDYLAGIFQKVLAPFKFIYRSYDNLFTATSQAVTDLNLFDDFRVWAQAVIIVLVLVGIVMLKIYLKVQK